jgi:hypothetical protein
MRDEYAQCTYRDEEPSAESFFTHACAERGPLEAAPGKARIGIGKLKIENI